MLSCALLFSCGGSDTRTQTVELISADELPVEVEHDLFHVRVPGAWRAESREVEMPWGTLNAHRFLTSFKPKSGWKEVVVEQDGFAVEVDRQTRHEVESPKSEGQATGHPFVRGAEQDCVVSVSRVAEEASTAGLERVIEDQLTSGGGKALRVTELAEEPLTRELLIEYGPGQQLLARTVQRHPYAYLLMVAAEVGKPKTEANQKCFETFALLDGTK